MAKRKTVTTYPNRGKASSQLMRLVVAVVLGISIALMAYIAVKGWDLLDGAKGLIPVFIAIYVVFILRLLAWSRGVLPLAAAFAIITAIFGGTAVQAWYQRDQTGYRDAALSGDLGFVTILFIASQALLIVVAIIGFSQNWQIEVEYNVKDDGKLGDAVPVS